MNWRHTASGILILKYISQSIRKILPSPSCAWQRWSGSFGNPTPVGLVSYILSTLASSMICVIGPFIRHWIIWYSSHFLFFFYPDTTFIPTQLCASRNHTFSYQFGTHPHLCIYLFCSYHNPTARWDCPACFRSPGTGKQSALHLRWGRATNQGNFVRFIFIPFLWGSALPKVFKSDEVQWIYTATDENCA